MYHKDQKSMQCTYLSKERQLGQLPWQEQLEQLEELLQEACWTSARFRQVLTDQ